MKANQRFTRKSSRPVAFQRWGVGLAVSILLLSGTTPAVAADDADSEAIAAAVASAAPSDLAPLPIDHSGGELAAYPQGGGKIGVATDPGSGMTLVSDDGSTAASISLPGAERLKDAVVSDDGSVTFAGERLTPSINVMASDEAVRISAVIASKSQTQEFSFDFGVGARVEIQPDGSALVLAARAAESEESVEVILASVEVPWARDAAGRPVSTHYVSEGGALVQVVDHRQRHVTYPVVADPTIDKPNVFQYRVRFNRAETAAIAAGGWGGVVGSVSCGVMAPVCALATGALAYQAGVAQNSKPKRCVQVTATQPLVVLGLIWWVDTYRGGPCR
ncbi:hypothetical protein [Microbacterium phyllosphaerae]|uniref:hypothetical protein n=1 Tax=Microbacterium phyllosphaerae TaxID=124798 RepID=UPI00216A88C9|nr:hypothetical protein [Microbacterium phyllosphaerae]MCS3442826.1 hypothetical protein [Microbacterium phyllosphaerae]